MWYSHRQAYYNLLLVYHACVDDINDNEYISCTFKQSNVRIVHDIGNTHVAVDFILACSMMCQMPDNFNNKNNNQYVQIRSK